jgi:hypothetical protein
MLQGMMERHTETPSGPKHTLGDVLAVLLARVVVPSWLLLGAVLKLMDASPSHLPVALVKWLGALGVDLMFVLQFSIAMELTVAGVMWLIPGLARAAGLVMLGAFLPVLVGGVVMGSTSCGCFGSVQVHPGLTILMDVSFFLGLLLLGRGLPSLAITSTLPTTRVVFAGLWTIGSFVIGFGSVGNAGSDPPGSAGGLEQVASGPAEGYYLPDYAAWIGRSWSDVPIARWVVGAPEIADSGPAFVLFYRKDCEHCHELMEAFFSGPLAVPTTAIAVPERSGFPTEGVLPFPCGECRTAELPAGFDWFLQTPVLVRLGDGIVECATEVTAAHPECLEW